jgi:hypothetical protein
VCFHHCKPLKTTHIQSNPIKKGYKTHICHGLYPDGEKNALIYSWGGHLFFKKKLRFVHEGAQQGI